MERKSTQSHKRPRPTQSPSQPAPPHQIKTSPVVPKYLLWTLTDYSLVRDRWGGLVKKALWWGTYKAQVKLHEDLLEINKFLDNLQD